ncbi:bifunctional 4-hydroxy-2-oxoglutarate aldolase/2-dehydro-3-deoxy-phosphogluconate aldolase [Pontibacter akesuensis]|uniref:2-dehydro-3-deoxyphosphogluconate aldolase / (4S)-4-hydroxy-2-oxoglutarate aldolase n=1 Tax=Pontibacter akesuensis TaxID=388950 RepID=A0A1I7K5W6_9BACT|nr:bifunctional 4-hydroxy-2-oxoglutarate aldolase/2-dehydro-3-deoxy-phosphogluconate aldolase [Pontibacter akesuensis]GHA74809.1 bifunctional 4-hydroxy-2-oxoglutarate aldolase/2-dehydro-3-deoxy-phosphogluconate aldolase [Pontibacter akesuensis]SFU92847.1 2-dehydro-3-deoxyphosphogluconate aldolase / (4S)-4-hydroxy-2-oxoglutarate aldolase [Pontibacter akesuensis]
MPTKQTALQAIVNQGLLPLFFYEDAEVSLEIIKTLYTAGIRTLEYTNRGPAALDNFTYLKSELNKEHQDLHLGIGTIKTAEEANAFIKAGADYIVAPIVDPKVGNIAYEASLLWIPGCFTPTEIHVAQQAQAALIKLFPANILGPVFLSSIKELFPGQLFIPTGGVELDKDNISTWFKAGVCAVGMGSKLISKDVLAQRQYEKLHAQTQQALELVKTSR